MRFNWYEANTYFIYSSFTLECFDSRHTYMTSSYQFQVSTKVYYMAQYEIVTLICIEHSYNKIIAICAFLSPDMTTTAKAWVQCKLDFVIYMTNTCIWQIPRSFENKTTTFDKSCGWTWVDVKCFATEDESWVIQKRKWNMIKWMWIELIDMKWGFIPCFRPYQLRHKYIKI